jgi:hypothetical protein
VDDHHGASIRGHMPEKAPKPIFIAFGPGIVHRLTPENSMLKKASAFLKILGNPLPGIFRMLEVFC